MSVSLDLLVLTVDQHPPASAVLLSPILSKVIFFFPPDIWQSAEQPSRPSRHISQAAQASYLVLQVPEPLPPPAGDAGLKLA